MDPQQDPFKPKHKRTRTGCLRCRRGKHKCDEEKPVCKRCRNANGECVWPDTAKSTPSTSSAVTSSKRSHHCIETQSVTIQELNEDSQVCVCRKSSRAQGNDQLAAASGNELDALFSSLTPTDYLTLTFPDSQERELMSHLLCFGTVIMYAIPIIDRPVLFLDIAQCLSNPRGSSIVSDAVHLSLISIAAVHQSSLFMQQEKKYLAEAPVNHFGSSPALAHASFPGDNQRRMRLLGDMFARTSLDLCRTGIVFQLEGQQHSTPVSLLATAESLLSSAMAVMISQSLAGGKLWQGAFDTALEIVTLCGGPAKMLDNLKGDPARLARMRTLLENLVAVDVCRCLASGSAPSLMNEPFAPWWFEHAPNPRISGLTDTVNHCYGMDRGFLELANRVNILVHDGLSLETLLDESQFAIHRQKVNDLLLEVDIWELDANGALPHKRVQYGNAIMINALKVVIYVDLVHYPHEHPLVQAAATAALEVLEDSRTLGFDIGQLLPTVITSSMMMTEDKRDRAREVITKLRSTVAFSYDIEETLVMLEKLYDLRDSGNIDPSWRLVTDTGLLFF
ncbi:hypothetical protein B9479_001880 [Cryptococcus floricola]|uniref:Zn(2)-C6 fungal-type domain-containing protein n=1 Tax=Cryptococcus floricola TaxID=2591691 RepID=A0A5D3B472_9TREE|nr:hypothetical protein B9479_001880 [Cryptococcus floricola]